MNFIFSRHKFELFSQTKIGLYTIQLFLRYKRVKLRADICYRHLVSLIFIISESLIQLLSTNNLHVLHKLNFHWTKPDRNFIYFITFVCYFLVLVHCSFFSCACRFFLWPRPSLGIFVDEAPQKLSFEQKTIKNVGLAKQGRYKNPPIC